MSNFWFKSETAAASADLLLARGDASGAVNRAYYAMFHAARSSLEVVGPDLADSKRHSTIIGRFAQHVIRARGLDPAIGRALNLATDQRLIADYERQVINESVAREVVKDMRAFLEAVAPLNAGRTT